MKTSLLENLSIENNKSNDGNLSFTFTEIIKLLEEKHNIKPLVEYYTSNNELVGYCVYYFVNNDTIQISQICIKKNEQNKGIGSYFLKKLENYNITADIALNNLQSQRFFRKNNFKLFFNEKKNRYRAERYLNGRVM